MLLEASMIVFAVLIALAVDQYWESREEVELGRTAIAAIRAEVERNRDQLVDNREDNRNSTRSTQAHLRALRNGDSPTSPPDVNYSFSLIGDDAWQTARVTRAIHFIDFELVTQIAQVYRIQEFFLRRQDNVVDAVASFMQGQAGGDVDVTSYASQLLISMQIECQLMLSYDLLLRRLDGGADFDMNDLDEQDAAACDNAWMNEPPAEAEATTGGF